VPTHALRPTADPRQIRDSNFLDVFARMKPGVTIQQARAQMDAIALRLEKDYPNDNMGQGATATLLQEDKVSGIRSALIMLGAAVGFLLLIGCANIANLQLARGAARAREISIRAALGADRRRLVRQLLTESILLAVIGGRAWDFSRGLGHAGFDGDGTVGFEQFQRGDDRSRRSSFRFDRFCFDLA
jgi:hypothetical protein